MRRAPTSSHPGAHGRPGAIDRLRAFVIVCMLAVTCPRGTSADPVAPDPTFFPYGLLWLRYATPSELAEHHFNTCYVRDDDALAREAVRAGLRLLVGPRSPASAERFASDPALAAWFILDDAAGSEDLATCRRRLEMIRAFDRDHPVFANQNGRTIESDRPFAELLDVYAPYAYPFPRQTIDWYADEFLDRLRDGVGRERLWTVVQCSGINSRHRRFGFDARQQSTLIDGAQFRLLFWTAVSHGARGVFLWPDFGLFDRYGWGRERLADAATIGCELEVLGEHLVAGEEVRRGAASPTPGIRVARVDRDGLSLLVVRRSEPGFEYAIGSHDDPATLDVAHRAGARAWLLTVDGLAPLAARDSGRSLRVTLEAGALDVIGFVLVDTSDEAAAALGDGMRELGSEFVRFAESAAEAHAERALGIIDHLTRLGRVDAVELAQHVELVAAWRDSPRRGIDSGARVRAANELRRALRGRLAELRDAADAFAAVAAPEAATLRLSPFTLPEFYSSFTAPR